MNPFGSYLQVFYKMALPTFSGLALLSSCAPASASELKYLERSPFVISAMLDGTEYIIEQLETESFDGYEAPLANEYSADRLRLVAQGDWDGDGFAEALYSPVRGGNCCPSQFRLISYSPKEGFRTHPFFEAWHNPLLEEIRLNEGGAKQWVFTVIENNEGWNTEDASQMRRRYVIQNGQPVLIDELVDEEMIAVKEIRSYQVETLLYDVLDLSMIQSVDVALLVYDIDNDGRNDQVRGYLWERWGRMRFYVKWADGTQTERVGQCKRIGILDSVTEGVHDLVCDNSDVFVWNGHRYEGMPNEAFDLGTIR